jgi:chaperonin GroES
MKIQPLEDKVLIKPTEETGEQKKGSIIVPETAKEKSQVGIIEAIGPESLYCIEDGKKVPKKNPPHNREYKVGDKVIYTKFGGTEFELEGTTYLIVDTKDLLAILNK